MKKYRFTARRKSQIKKVVIAVVAVAVFLVLSTLSCYWDYGITCPILGLN